MSDLRDINMLEADLDAAYCRVDFNVEFAELNGNKLYMEIISPALKKDDPRRFPLIVFSQGSSWMKQDLGKEIAQLSAFAQRGFVIAIAEYRSVETAGFPAQVIDTKTAIVFMQEHAAEYRVDPEQIILWGTSSGGHTVLMAGVTAENAYYEGHQPLNIKAVIDYYGPTDVTKIIEEKDAYKYEGQPSPLPLLIGTDNIWHRPDLTDQMCPMYHIERQDHTVPILIMHGNADRMVPYQQSIELFTCLKQRGRETVFYLLKGADHGGGCFWTVEMLDRVEAFIRRYIG